MGQKTISIKKLHKIVDSVCKKNRIPKRVGKLIKEQLDELAKKHYGKVPKDEALKILSEQLEILQKGYKIDPVDIEEFILSPDYLDLRGIIRPAILDFLIDLHRNHPECYEVVIGGAAGLGKTFSVCVSMAYEIYKLSCLFSPQVFFSLAPGSEIVFSFQSLKEEKAIRNLKELANIITRSPYFKENLILKVQKKNIVFVNDISAKVFTSAKGAAISENVFSAFIDEANWMKVFDKRNTELAESGVFDQATMLYKDLKDRIEGRFKNFSTNALPGKIYLVSSANYEDDFISRKEEEAKTNKHIYVFHKALWEVKPMQLSGKKFWVRLPTENQPPRLLFKKPKSMSGVIEVPIEFRKAFEENPYDSIRNIAGVPISRNIRFIPHEALRFSNVYYEEIYREKKIFKKENLKASNFTHFSTYFNLEYMELLSKFYSFGCHIDIGIKEDATGIAVGFVPCVRKINAQTIILVGKGHVAEDYDGFLPVFTICGVLRVDPSGSEINIDQILEFVLALKHALPTLRFVSFDKAFSTSLIQQLRKVGITTFLQSVDRKIDPYMEMREALINRRLLLPESEVIESEFKYLIHDTSRNKVDHDRIHGKDVSDAIASVCYSLARKPFMWCKEDRPYKLKELLELAGSKEIQQQNRSDRLKVVHRPKIERLKIER